VADGMKKSTLPIIYSRVRLRSQIGFGDSGEVRTIWECIASPIADQWAWHSSCYGIALYLLFCDNWLENCARTAYHGRRSNGRFTPSHHGFL